MKQIYKKPALNCVVIRIEQLLAGMSIHDEMGNGSQLSKSTGFEESVGSENEQDFSKESALQISVNDFWGDDEEE
jgi:hypothetical protein